MQADPLVGWAFSSGLLSLRISPVFALAPPFSLTKVPPLFRALFGAGIAVCLVSAYPAQTAVSIDTGSLVVAGLRELLLGSIFVLAFQLTFGALYMAGRVIDVQAGYGLAMVIDPATRTQAPMVGTYFALLAGVVFFAIDGPGDLLRLFAASVEAMPVGQGTLPATLGPLTRYISVVFLGALGVGGGTVLALFLTDLAIAALARTVPQMNVLVLGFQIKALVLMLVLPVTLGLSSALLLRLLRLTLEGLPGLL